MIVGAFITGTLAAIRPADPNAAGLRAGFLGSVLAVLTLIVTVVGTAASGATMAWPYLESSSVSSLVDLFCVPPLYSVWYAAMSVDGWQTPSPHDGRQTRTCCNRHSIVASARRCSFNRLQSCGRTSTHVHDLLESPIVFIFSDKRVLSE